MTWLRQNNGRIAALALIVVLLGTTVAALAGPAWQLGLWSFGTGFIVVRWAVYVVAAGGALCLLSTLIAITVYGRDFASNAPVAAAGLVIAVFVIYVPYAASRPGNPPIHDVTTDLDNPPAFVEVARLREDTGARNTTEYQRGAPNTADYQRVWTYGERVINVPELQKQAFPDIQPVILDLQPSKAFEKAGETVRELGWTVVSEEPEKGRIEAYDRTAWFGFIDDVVIRVQPSGGGSRIDVRSVSRVGLGDRGMNAMRIRNFVRTLMDSGVQG